MSVLSTGLWKGPVNTKIPAISHWFSLRLTGIVSTTNASVTFALPSNYLSPGQNAVVTGTPSASAGTATPYDPNSEPQLLNAVFVPTLLQIRDLNGIPVSAGTSAAGTLTVSLFNSNISAVNNLTGVVTRSTGSAISGSNTLASISFAASTTGLPLWSLESVHEAPVGALTSLSATAALTGTLSSPTSVASANTATALAGVLTKVRPGLGDQLALNVTVASYVAGSTTGATLTALTADVLGFWQQGV